MLIQLPVANIRAVFSDLDDTLTDHSKVGPQTYECLWKLRTKGFWVAIISGRPAGWADCLMRLWPIDAMVFENGAGLMVRDGDKIKTICLANEKNISEQRAHLQKTFDALKNEIPNLKLATDQSSRLFDFAIDYVEEEPHLTDAELKRVLEFLGRDKQITHKLSSIHVNYWFGKHTKVTACKHLLELEGLKRGITKEEVVFSGDSPNDEPLFEYFTHTVGVANIKKYLSKMKHPPKHYTQSPGGEGFQELVGFLTAK